MKNIILIMLTMTLLVSCVQKNNINFSEEKIETKQKQTPFDNMKSEIVKSETIAEFSKSELIESIAV
jgi:uncharacterized protein YcfL